MSMVQEKMYMDVDVYKRQIYSHLKILLCLFLQCEL